MTRLHVICKRDLNLRKIEGTRFESGFWLLKPDDAERLIGGMLFLHETKATPSYFGGIVESCRIAGTDTPAPGKIIFTFQASPEGRGQRWRGRDDPRASVGGVVDD